jgi:hypothetical protein
MQGTSCKICLHFVLHCGQRFPSFALQTKLYGMRRSHRFDYGLLTIDYGPLDSSTELLRRFDLLFPGHDCRGRFVVACVHGAIAGTVEETHQLLSPPGTARGFAAGRGCATLRRTARVPGGGRSTSRSAAGTSHCPSRTARCVRPVAAKEVSVQFRRAARLEFVAASRAQRTVWPEAQPGLDLRAGQVMPVAIRATCGRAVHWFNLRSWPRRRRLLLCRRWGFLPGCRKRFLFVRNGFDVPGCLQYFRFFGSLCDLRRRRLDLLHGCICRLEEPVHLPGAALRVRQKHQGSHEENRGLFHDHALSLEPETKMGTGTASCRANPHFRFRL